VSARSVAAIAGALLVVAGCTPPPDCIPRCGDYHYDDFAMLRVCRVSAFDSACSEPWTLGLVRPDGAPFRGLGDIDEVSVPRTPSASWILARRTVPSPPPDVASMGTYVVYDLAGETVGYEGADYGAAYAEWVRRNRMPAAPDGNTVSINAWGIDDFADRFPPTWATRIREWAFDARSMAAFLTKLLLGR
jgi:hypothetical protein